MKLTCPQCHATLQLDPVMVPQQGMNVSCYQCLSPFFLTLPQGPQGQANLSPLPPPPPKAPPTTSREPGRATPPPFPAAVASQTPEIDFSAMGAQGAPQAPLPDLNVGEALFGRGSEFGFDLSAPKPSVTPPAPPPAPPPARPSRPKRPTQASADLPQPSPRQAAPKAFTAARFDIPSAGGPMESVFVEETPPPQTPPTTPFNAHPPAVSFLEEPAPPPASSQPQASLGQGQELFAVQEGPAQGQELFAVQEGPAQGGVDLFSAHPQGVDQLFNASLGEAHSDDLFEMTQGSVELFSQGADALFELGDARDLDLNTPAPQAMTTQQPAPQSFEMPQSFELPQSAEGSTRAITPLPHEPVEGASQSAQQHEREELEGGLDLNPETHTSHIEPTKEAQEAAADATQAERRRPPLALLIALGAAALLAGVHLSQPALLPTLLASLSSEEPQPTAQRGARRLPQLEVVTTSGELPQEVKLSAGPTATQTATQTANTTSDTRAHSTPAQTKPTPVPSATQGEAWHPLSPSLIERLSSRSLTPPTEALSTPTALEPEGARASLNGAPVEAQRPLERSQALSMGALSFPHDAQFSREARGALNSLPPELINSPEGAQSAIAASLALGLDHAQEHAIALGLSSPNDASHQALMGYAYEQRQQTALAKRAFERALELKPSSEALKATLTLKVAELNLAHGELNEAESQLKALQGEGFDAPVVRRRLAELELKRERPREAFSWIKSLFEQPQARLSPYERAEQLITFASVLNLDEELSKEAGERSDDEVHLNRERTRHEALVSAVKSWPDHVEALKMLFAPAHEARREAEALKELESIAPQAQGAPQGVELSATRAALLTSLDRDDKALEQLERSAAAHPDSFEAQVHLGRALIERRDFVRAREVFAQATSLEPNTPRSTLLMSELLIKEARVDEAQALLERAILSRPWSPDLHRGLAELKFKIGLRNGQERLLKEAYQSYERVLELNPSDQHTRAQFARSAIRLGEPERALEQLKRLSKEPAYRAQLDFELGEAKMALKRDGEAQDHFERVLKREPSHLEAHRAMGKLHERSGRNGRAKEAFEQALALNPRDPDTRYELGKLALKTQQVNEAIEHLRVTAEAKLQDPDAQYWFARALEQSDQKSAQEEALTIYDSAARLLRERLSKPPKHLCDIYFRLGQLHTRSLTDISLAPDDFSRASQCDPSRADVWSALAAQYERLGDQKRASTYYRDALKRDKSFPPALVGLARDDLRAASPNRKRAEQRLKRAISRDPKLPEAHYQLCKLYQSSRAKARKVCKAYLKLSPKGEFASEVREILSAL